MPARKSHYVLIVENMSSATRSNDVKCGPRVPGGWGLGRGRGRGAGPDRAGVGCAGRSSRFVDPCLRWSAITSRGAPW